MIVTPNAQEVIDLLRLAGKGKRLVKTDKVYLLRWRESGAEKILLWDRVNYPPPPPPVLTDYEQSFTVHVDPPPYYYYGYYGDGNTDTETVHNVVIIEQDGELVAVPAINP